MTDEEIDRMADNFVNAQDFTKLYSVARKAECGAFWKYGFLAGLKAGRPKWHKVAAGDLPSEEGGWVCNQNGLPCYFDWSTEQWLDCEGTQIRTTEWCHMPHKE